MRTLFAQTAAAVRDLASRGKVADYIPALARVSPDKLAISAATIEGERWSTGDHAEPFSIQSISKVFTLTLVMRAMADELWERVGREPSGDPFNSLVQLEYERGRPRNPFINAGALVVADCMITSYADAKARLAELVAELTGEEASFDAEVARSEAETGFRNRSLAHLMKSFGNIRNDVDEVVDLYFTQCALAMTSDQLARAFRYLANEGREPASGEEILSPLQARRVNSLLLTCGTYDAAGESAFRVGLPVKSGVGGGMVAIVPRRLALSVWSPALDATGNSVAGRAALERLATAAGWSVF
ncbi:MAG: glutaminase [Acidimicrobiia bacterium]|nr:glutaminase [Acidimicrobiia bacterium]